MSINRGRDKDVVGISMGYCHCLVTKSCLTLVNSLPDSSVLGISQARVLEWVAISSSRDPPDPGIKLVSPALAGGFFTTKPPGKPHNRILLSHKVERNWIICREVDRHRVK